MDLGEGERILAVDPGPSSEAAAACVGRTITVRPEWIKLERQDAGASDRGVATWAGPSSDVVYLGSVTQMIVILRTGERLTVHRLNDEVGAVEPRPGDRVILHWDAAHSFVIGTPRAGATGSPPAVAGSNPVATATPGLIEGRKCERWARTTDR